jgi:hypothetical protein
MGEYIDDTYCFHFARFTCEVSDGNSKEVREAASILCEVKEGASRISSHEFLNYSIRRGQKLDS